MRGMPSICITAQRVCGARDANIRTYRIVFRYACEKGDAVRITIRMAIRFSCGGKAAYDRDRWSLSIFKTPVLF